MNQLVQFPMDSGCILTEEELVVEASLILLMVQHFNDPDDDWIFSGLSD